MIRPTVSRLMRSAILQHSMTGRIWQGIQWLFRELPSSHYVLLALLFFAGLELIVVFHRWLWLTAVVLLALLAYGVYLVRVEERGRFHPTQAILPLLAATGLTGFTLFLPATGIRHLYFAIASLLFFWLLRHGARQAYPTWNWTISTLTLLLNTAVILGLRFHLYLPLLFTLIMLFVVSFLISAQALRRVANGALQTTLLSLSLALALTELAWTLQFLPVHFLVQAGTIVVTYYVFFHTVSLSLERKLARAHLVEYAVLGAATLAVLLVTARWI